MMQYGLATPFYGHFQKSPTLPALHVEGRTYSYSELGEYAGRLATLLQASGPIRRVGILASRSLEAMGGILAAAWAGATFVPLNPKYPEERLATIMANARLDALILDEAGWHTITPHTSRACPPLLIAPRLDQPAPTGITLHGRDTFQATLPSPPRQTVEEEATAYLLYTSGTTGVPKGVMVTNGNVAHFLQVSQERYRIASDDRLSQQSEITFDHIVFDLFMAWGNGASVHVVPERMLMAPGDFIRQQRLTVWFAVPSVISFLQTMRLLKEGSFPGLRLSLFAGEPLPLESAKAWQAAAPNSRIDNLYGPTEVTIDCLWQPFTPPYAITPNREVVAIGRPYPGMTAEVVDKNHRFLAPGEIGELAVSGPQVAAGYWQNPELTERRYPRLHHPILGNRRWYLTGDLSYQDQEGIFHYLGRVDNQVKVLGQRLELEDVEFHLRQVSGCDAVAVIAWPVEHGSAQGLVAFVTDPDLDLKEIKNRLRERVLAYMVPRRILHVERLPLNLNGKVDRRALAALLSG